MHSSSGAAMMLTGDRRDHALLRIGVLPELSHAGVNHLTSVKKMSRLKGRQLKEEWGGEICIRTMYCRVRLGQQGARYQLTRWTVGFFYSNVCGAILPFDRIANL